jgi:hypothetical protein
MTLILSLAAPGYAIQAVDRRLSYVRHSDKGTKIFDDHANKTIVYQISGGIFLLSYTGLSYLDGVPTDQWIVERLIDHEYPKGKKWLMAGRSVSSYRGPLGSYLRRLCSELSKKLGSTHTLRQSPITVVGVGLVLKHDRVCPTIFRLHVGNEQYVVEYDATKHWLWAKFPNRFICDVSPDGSIGDEKLATFRAKLRACRRGNVDQVEEVLVSTVSAMSADSKLIGPDVLSAAIGFPLHEYGVRIRFFPQTPHNARLTADGPIEPVTYTPWVLAQGAVFHPAMATRQSQEWNFAGVKVVFENMAKSDKVPQGGPTKLSGQPRPREPRR